MNLELRILSGARAGQREHLSGARVAVGRHPSNDFRFDPDQDRDVSSRHAELLRRDDRWILRDLGSTNGTLVNGAAIAGEVVLQDGDVISFGAEGPRVEVRFAGAGGVAPATIVSPPRGSAAVGAGTRPSASAPGTTTREHIRVAVSQQTRTFKMLLAAAIVIALGGVAAALWVNASNARTAQRQIAALLARNDSLEESFNQSVRAVRGDLEAALDSERREVAVLRERLQSARNDNEVEALSRQLSQLEQKRQALLSGNYPLIDSLNRSAVAMVAVEKPDGTIEGASAFGVSRDGLVVTNRHVVLDSAGRRPARVAVIFNDTREWRPARLVRISASADLALLKVEDGGPTPAVAGISASQGAVRVGSPVAIIGFPLSLDTPMPGSGLDITASSTLGPGTVSKMIDDVVQIDAFAGTGSSGSPLFDGRGHVVGVIYGGARDSGGRIVYAVPGERVIELLRR